MDSYNFSSDPTSSFFVKETTSDGNTVIMDNIADSILQLNSTEINQSVSEDGRVCDITDSKIDPKYKVTDDDDANLNSNDVFVITVDDANNTSTENEKIAHLSVSSAVVQDSMAEYEVKNDTHSELVESCSFEIVKPLVEVNKDEKQFSVEISKATVVGNGAEEEFADYNLEMTLDPSNDSSRIETVNNLNEAESNENEVSDSSVDKFDMEDFLSFKIDKSAVNPTTASDKNDKRNAIIKKYFTECGSNSVKCNLCSDVLLSNLPNLILHLRHVHKNDKSELIGKVWKYFTKVDAFKAKCSICSNLFVFRNRISVLVKHLRFSHKINMESDFKSMKDLIKSEDEKTSDENSPVVSPSSDVIVIKNSDGKLINQIKVNKSWKCFTKLPNSDKMICNLCKKIFTHNKTNDLLQHLHEEHKNLLSIKQHQTFQESFLIKSEYLSNEEDSNKSLTTEVAKSVIVSKVSKHPNRSGKSVKSSKIWEYFTQLNNDKIKCNLCNKVLANNYSTSNLLRHLNARHIEAYNIIKDLSASDTNAIKIVIQNEKGEPEKDVSVADMLADYENMLTPNEIVSVGELKTVSKMKQPMSETWKYFTKLKNVGKVKCNLCKIMLSYTDGVSSNLTRHLKLKHKELFDKQDDTQTEEIDEAEQNSKRKKSVSISKVLTKRGKFDGVKKSTNSPRKLKPGPKSKKLNKLNASADVTIKLEPPSDDIPTSVTEFKLDSVESCNEIDNKNKLNDSNISSEENKIHDNKLRSKAWDYFKKMVSDNKVVCNICLQEISFTKGSTYKLFRHLALKHKITFKRHPKPRKIFAYESDTTDEESSKYMRKQSKTSAIDNDGLLSDEDSELNESTNRENVKFSEVKVTGRTWKHFTKLDREKAKCNICGKVLTYKLGQTSNLIKHMQLKHKEVDNKNNSSKQSKEVKEDGQSEGVDQNTTAIELIENSESIVWKYFTKLENNKAMCNLCEFPNILNYSDKSNSNLVKHLNRKHKNILKISGDYNLFIQTPDISYFRKYDSSFESKTSDDSVNANESVGTAEHDDVQDMKSLFEYLITDDKLKRCIKFEDDQIKCKICSGSFVCENLINYEYTIRYHVQLFHAEWTVMCFDESLIKRECISPVSDHDVSETHHSIDVAEPSYNELEAIAKEVNSFMDIQIQDQAQKQVDQANDNNVVSESSNIKTDYKTLSDDIWKYFTKLTSQNVRCNFCSILLSFRQHKKWNLIRHLKLKHKSKLNISIYKKSRNIKKIKKSKILSNNKTLKKSAHIKANKSLKKSKLPFKKIISNSSPTKKIKSDPDITVGEMLNETDKSDNSGAVKKNNISPIKPIKKIKIDLEEQKQISISSFNSPINRKIGRTWSHFTKIEMGKAQCNICNNILLYRGTGIDLLNDHLTGEHSSYFDGSSNFEPQKSFHKKINFDSDDYISSEERNVDSKDYNSSNLKTEDEKNDEDSKKPSSRVWQYFAKAENGYAKCQLCLSEISCRGTTSNLMRHLQKIHSVISLLTPDTKTPDITETEQSKLLAAVDLTPTRLHDKNHVCFIRLNKNMVRCNFCPRVLFHKSGNMHKLMSHMLYKHRQETKKYKSLKNMRFFDNGSEIIMIVNDKRERASQSSDASLSEQKIDKRKIYRSNTWLYFTKLNEHYAKCNICFNAFSYKGGSIYNLTRHLLIKHDVKLIKRYEIPYKKCSPLITSPTTKATSISKKKSETLLFYKRINRYVVRCKLCMKRFIYKGINIGRLINHLWSSHITKIIEIGGSHHSSVFKNIDSSQETESSVVKDSGANDEEEDTELNGNIKEVNATGRKSSSTWNYFTDLNDAERNVRCNICQKIFCFKSGNLSNLSRHLENNHKIKKTSNHANAQNCNISDNNENVSSDEKKKLQQNNTNENLNFSNYEEEDLTNIDRNEIYVFFLKMNNSDNEVQCKFCDEVLKRDNLKNLKVHLSVKHDIYDFLSPKSKEKAKEELSDTSQPSENGVRQKSSTSSKNKNTSRMKCKLCYKEFISRESNFLVYLVEHLSAFHEQHLKDDEKLLLQEFNKDNHIFTSNTDGSCEIESNEKKEAYVKPCLNIENMALRYFKNLKLFKNKCKICYKYISSKRPCYHHVTNDITLRYSIRKSKQKSCDMKPEGKISCVGDEETKSQAISAHLIEKFHPRNVKIKHFMSVNLNDNKCYDCMAARNFGYCIHSLNLWLMNENKKKFDNTKLNSELNNQISLNTDEVQLIANSLNGCSENNIIIITDNDDTSVLNYNDITSRNESGTQDISYHIMNSINDIDDDDIKVIIYKYNSEEGNENEVNQENGVGSSVKIREIAENTSADNVPLSSHKVFDDIVNELNGTSQLIYNSDTGVGNNGSMLKEKNEAGNSVAQEDEQTKNEEIENLDSHVIPTPTNGQMTTEVVPESDVTYQRPFNLEKLTELAEVSCNEQFYKRNSMLNFAEQSVAVENVPYSEPVNVQHVKTKVGSDRCIVENIYPEDHRADGSISVEKEYVTRSDVVYKDDDVESAVVAAQSQNDYIESAVVKSHNNNIHDIQEVSEQNHGNMDSTNKNEVISEDVINAIFNEVIVNLQENTDGKELNLIKLNNDDIEIPPGLYLQNLKGVFKINKIVLFFSNINYKYKTAKCNLCKMYLEFAEPIIYNLLMHLFSHHKDKVCTEEPINKSLVDDETALDSINKPRRKSPVWKYFMNEKNFRAICKICHFSFSYKGGAINNLSRHLRLRHNIIVSSKNSDDPNYDVGYMLSYPKRRSAVKLRSKTWNYFSKEPNDWAKCRICKKYLSYRSSTINNLTRHLRTIHSKIFNSLFTDKDPIFIKNEDGSLSENLNFINNDENSDIYNSLLMETSNTKTRDEILQQCSYSSMENNNRRKSIVWNYFTEITPNCGKCNFCSKVISCKGGGTSNLSRHLRSRHGIWIVLTSNLSQTFNETMNHDLNPNAADNLNSIGSTEMNDTIITQEQLHILKNRKLIHKKSKTWEYFTKESADRVRCNLCSKPLSYKCKAVHNLRRHLAKKHPSCVVKPDPVRLKLQINAENDVLHNSNDVHDAMITEANKKFIDITDTSVVIVDEETQLPPHRPDRNSRPKKSIVWNYFEELEYGIAKCLICSKILSFRGGGTNNLMRHLRCRHAIIIVNQTVDSTEKEPVVIAECDNNDDSDTVNVVNLEQEESNTVSDTNNIENV